jgi:hypothetical protein
LFLVSSVPQPILFPDSWPLRLSLPLRWRFAFSTNKITFFFFFSSSFVAPILHYSLSFLLEPPSIVIAALLLRLSPPLRHAGVEQWWRRTDRFVPDTPSP